MGGQGRPYPLGSGALRRLLCLCAALCAAAGLLAPVLAADGSKGESPSGENPASTAAPFEGALASKATALPAGTITRRIRVEWGEGKPRRWSFAISLSEGRFSDLVALGVEADTPGSMQLDDDGRIYVAEPGPRAYDGFDVTVTAPEPARLIVEWAADSRDLPRSSTSRRERFRRLASPSRRADKVAHPDKGPRAEPADDEDNEIHPDRGAGADAGAVRKEFALPLTAGRDEPLDARGNRISVRRAPGDALRVVVENSSLVLSPREKLALIVEPSGVEPPEGARLKLEASLSGPVGRGWSTEVELEGPGPSWPAVPLGAPAPREEGPHEIHLVLRARNRLGVKSTLAERKIQFVVVAHDAPTAGGKLDAAPSVRPEVVAEIDPTGQGWRKRLANWSRLPGLNKGPLSHGASGRVESPLGPLLELSSSVESDPSWQALPLPVKAISQPHLVEVSVPAERGQTLGVSVLEPGPDGSLQPIVLDSGVYGVSGGGDDGPLVKHELIFWPRTRSPVLLLTNLRPGATARFAKVRLLSLGQLAPLEMGEAASTSGRSWAVYLDRPLFPENFLAPQLSDAHSGRSVDDWNTFYQGATRLVQYLKHAGVNLLFIAALADGSAIYPSRLVGPTPRYDTGALASSGADPVRKDVLELLLRLCDREQIRVVPVLHFSAPLPGLEALARDGGEEATGLRLLNERGLSWPEEFGARRGLAAHYNPLDPAVQQSMRDVIDELARRYSSHPCFAGAGVQLSAQGFAQLPGAEWGFDDRTVAAFSQETRTIVKGKGPGRFAARAQQLLGPDREKWLAWRARRMTGLYRGLREAVAASGATSAPLYLLPTGLLDAPEGEARWRPALPRREPLDRALLEAGLAEELAKEPGIVVFRPQRLVPPGVSGASGLDREFADSRDVDETLWSGSTRAALFFHPPQEARLASFDAQSPFPDSYTWLVSQVSPADAENRRRFAHRLAQQDLDLLCDGGWMLALGQESTLRDMTRVFRSLPRGMTTLKFPTQPVVIRRAAAGQRQTLALINDSPWELTVRLQFAGKLPGSPQSLSPERKLPAFTENDQGSQWAVTLSPYELVGANLPPGELTDARVDVDPAVADALASRIETLRQRAAALRRPSPLESLKNTGFESQEESGQPENWTLLGAPGAEAALDERDPHGGRRSLKLSAQEKSATVLSDPFPPPRTGRLCVSAFLRCAAQDAGDTKAASPRLRLAFEGTLGGRPYVRQSSVGGPDAQPALGDAWNQFVFPVADLPTSGLSQLRVRLELEGPGEIWIDDVQLYDLVFSSAERVELDTRIIALAHAHLERGEWGDCWRLLDSHWPRFLETHAPLPMIARAPRNVEPTEDPPPPPPREAAKPTWWERLRESLPEKLRF